MRMFLPIKGPGGRTLTPREKLALVILGVTLVLCVLTLLAGPDAYDDTPARNPVYALVGGLSRTLGGGIVALYGLVLLWSGLIYFKGERIADVTPIRGRVFAALAVTVGISGALGLARLETAGSLGSLVGGALGSALGGPLGLPMLLILMLLGFHLAGKGAWSALRRPVLAAAAPIAAGPTGLWDAPARRMAHDSPLPEDGDPTPDERSLAVTQAVEEIERSHGVTIVEVEPGAALRPSIGEEVEAAPEPEPESEEAQIQEGLRRVSEVLESGADDAAVVGETEEEEYATEVHGLVPVGAEDEDLETAARAEAEEPAGGTEPETEAQVEAREEAAGGDPYATPGLLRRTPRRPGIAEPGNTEHNYSSFDWRGRPLD